MKGIVDRIEEGFLVVELEDGEMINIEKTKAPLAKEGDVLKISKDKIIIDKEETKKREERIKEKFNDLFE